MVQFLGRVFSYFLLLINRVGEQYILHLHNILFYFNKQLMCYFHISHNISLNSRYIAFFICFCYRVTSSFDIGFTFLRTASSTVSSIDGRGTVSMSNMRNSKKYSYKFVIWKGVNLKRVLVIENKLFEKYIKCFI